jgi:hypothetical protein
MPRRIKAPPMKRSGIAFMILCRDLGRTKTRAACAPLYGPVCGSLACHVNDQWTIDSP